MKLSIKTQKVQVEIEVTDTKDLQMMKTIKELIEYLIVNQILE
jgi:hypothetical protein